jgi:hypothetical protein
MTELYRLRYIPGTPYGDQYPSIRYPARRGVNKQTAELMRRAMPRPELFEIVEEGE